MTLLRRFGLPAVLLLEGILIGRMLPEVERSLRRRLTPLPGGAPAPSAPPWGDGCPGCWTRSQELAKYGHTHILGAYSPMPAGADEPAPGPQTRAGNR